MLTSVSILSFCLSLPQGASISSVSPPMKGVECLSTYFYTSRPFISILSSYFFMLLLLLLLWTLHLAAMPSACPIVASCLQIEQTPCVIGQRRAPGNRADITFSMINSSQRLFKAKTQHLVFSMKECPSRSEWWFLKKPDLFMETNWCLTHVFLSSLAAVWLLHNPAARLDESGTSAWTACVPLWLFWWL